MMRKAKNGCCVALLLLVWGITGIQATTHHQQLTNTPVAASDVTTDKLGSRGEAWLIASTQTATTALYAADIKGYWAVARHQVPHMFNADELTVAQKLQIMLYVLVNMQAFKFKQKPHDYAYNYKTALTIINSNNLLGQAPYQTPLSLARAEELKKTLLQEQFHYTLQRIIVKDQLVAQAIARKVNQVRHNKQMSVFQDLAKRCSLLSTTRVPEVSLTAMPAFYHKPVHQAALHTALVCQDKARQQYHVLLLTAKTSIPFSYDEVEYFEYTVPLAFYPQEHILAQQKSQEPQENRAENNRLMQEMLSLLTQRNFDPLQDQSRCWLKRTINCLYCEDLSLPISTGAFLWQTLNPQAKSTINGQIFGDPRNLTNTREPYFFKNYAGNLKQEKCFIKEVIGLERNGVKSFSIIFINKVTKVTDNPDVVREFVLQTLLVEDAHVIAQIMDNINDTVAECVTFCRPQEQLIQELQQL